MPLSNSVLFTDSKTFIVTEIYTSECSSEYSSKQNFPGVHAPGPPPLAKLCAYGARVFNKCIGQILGLDPALSRAAKWTIDLPTIDLGHVQLDGFSEFFCL